ncbi:hypothetical protein [Mycoplasma sp. ATU-Cv-508]|uniref:hypothetical protein n=1 Tax=Mycoplasma sp. ATU-Cv-508 TaxID=2048001 RepID=UPI000FDECF13
MGKWASHWFWTATRRAERDSKSYRWTSPKKFARGNCSAGSRSRSDQIFQTDQGESLKQIVSQKVPWLEFVYQKTCPQNAQTPREIEIFVKQMAPFLKLANRLEWEFYLKKMAREFDLSLEVLTQMMLFGWAGKTRHLKSKQSF